jgi:hypothetical protein
MGKAGPPPKRPRMRILLYGIYKRGRRIKGVTPATLNLLDVHFEGIFGVPF